VAERGEIIVVDLNDPWMQSINLFFERNPERNFWVGVLPLTSLPLVGEAGWIVGVSSSAKTGAGPNSMLVAEGASGVPCIVRRGGYEADCPLNGVFILDATGPLPSLPNGRDQEGFAAYLWGLAQLAERAGVSLYSFVARAGAHA